MLGLGIRVSSLGFRIWDLELFGLRASGATIGINNGMKVDRKRKRKMTPQGLVTISGPVAGGELGIQVLRLGVWVVGLGFQLLVSEPIGYN